MRGFLVMGRSSALAFPDVLAAGQAAWDAAKRGEDDRDSDLRMDRASRWHLAFGREIDFASGPYGAFKAAIVHYTQGLAYHLAAKRIRANTVSPGNTYFEGGVWNQIEHGNPQFFKEALALNPTGRMGTPQEMANAVVFLASPAASFITGTNLVVDGALTKGVQL